MFFSILYKLYHFLGTKQTYYCHETIVLHKYTVGKFVHISIFKNKLLLLLTKRNI